MKTKIVVLVGLALCAMLLMSPALASDAGTLEIYGNANEDDTIDMRDLTYVKLIFFGKKPETELADAKYDGKINPLDFIQIKLIIVGKEKEITIVDSVDRIVTVNKPVERIVVTSGAEIEAMRALKINAGDKIVGVPSSVLKREIFFPEFSGYPDVGGFETGGIDIEQVLSLHPDTVIVPAHPYPDERVEKFIDMLPTTVTAIRFDCRKQESMIDEVRKLGYVFNKKEEASEYIDFYERWMDTLKSRVEEISEEEKPRVYLEAYRPNKAIASGTYHRFLESAGGCNIFSDFTGWPEVDPESVMTRNPEIIVRLEWRNTGYDVDDTTTLSDIRNELINRPELANVAAVKNERVHIISEKLFGAPTHFVALAYMAKWFHPELFEDMDTKAKHQEYLTRFQGLDYDLDEHGVFVFPPFED